MLGTLEPASSRFRIASWAILSYSSLACAAMSDKCLDRSSTNSVTRIFPVCSCTMPTSISCTFLSPLTSPPSLGSPPYPSKTANTLQSVTENKDSEIRSNFLLVHSTVNKVHTVKIQNLLDLSLRKMCQV